MTILKRADGPFLEMHIIDGESTVKYVPAAELFGKLWDDYIHEYLTDEYMRQLLEGMLLKPTDVFNMMERLQMGKAKYKKSDYQEMAYI